MNSNFSPIDQIMGLLGRIRGHNVNINQVKQAAPSVFQKYAMKTGNPQAVDVEDLPEMVEEFFQMSGKQMPMSAAEVRSVLAYLGMQQGQNVDYKKFKRILKYMTSIKSYMRI